MSTEALRQGTTTIECKSGYGLTVDDEARSLRIAGELTSETTYLGAHVVPVEYADDATAYVDLVTGPMLDACAPHARFVDVFCERGAFDADQARAILTAGAARGLLPKIHANQLGPGPGVRLAVELGAVSADHCTHLDAEDVEALAGSSTVATLLPGAEFSTRSPYPDARGSDRRRRHGGAGDRLQPRLELHHQHGVVRRPGRARDAPDRRGGGLGSDARRRAARSPVTTSAISHRGRARDLQVLDAPSYVHLAYRPGVPLVRQVWRDGVRQV